MAKSDQRFKMRWDYEQTGKERRQKLYLIIDQFFHGQCNVNKLKEIQNLAQIEENLRKCVIQKAKEVYLNCYEQFQAEYENGQSEQQRQFKPELFLKKKEATEPRQSRPKSCYGIRSVLRETELSKLRPSTSKLEETNHMSETKTQAVRLSKTKKDDNHIDLNLRFDGLGISKQPRKVKVFQQIWREWRPILIFQKQIIPKQKINIKAKSCQPPVDFCLYILVDELKDGKINTCCSLKRSPGSKVGHFTLLSIEGGTSCGHSIIKKVSKRNDKSKVSKKVKIEESTKEVQANEESYEDEFEEFESEQENVNETMEDKSLDDEAELF